MIIVALIIVGVAAYFLFLAPKDEVEPVEQRGSYSPGDHFITNVKDSQMLVKASVVLEVNRSAEDEEFYAFLDENKYKIRDAIVFVLREKTADQLQQPNIKAILTDEMVEKINQVLEIDNVKTIYFTDYVVQ